MFMGEVDVLWNTSVYYFAKLISHPNWHQHLATAFLSDLYLIYCTFFRCIKGRQSSQEWYNGRPSGENGLKRHSAINHCKFPCSQDSWKVEKYGKAGNGYAPGYCFSSLRLYYDPAIIAHERFIQFSGQHLFPSYSRATFSQSGLLPTLLISIDFELALYPVRPRNFKRNCLFTWMTPTPLPELVLLLVA